MGDSEQMQALLDSLMHPELKEIDLSLGRIEQYLAEVGNPHLSLPPVIHVAGTNGKGSTIAFMRAMFEAAGYSVHVYSSPHLVSVTERFVIAGQEVEADTLYKTLMQVKALTEEYPLTFFEALTVAAFQLFAKTPADVALLEVGMGGRFDATNVIADPLATVITPVAMDHQAFLGNTLAKIAFEKAGIIKPHCPVFVGRQLPEALEVIEQVAREKSAPLILVDDQWNKLSPVLAGVHQRDNAALAATVLSHCRAFSVEEAHIMEGVAQAHWPGRLQKLTAGLLVDLAENETEIWLDGGHNEQAGQALAGWIRAHHYEPITLIVGMTAQKDPAAFLSAFQGMAAEIVCIDIPQEPSGMSREQLCDAAKQLELPVRSAMSLSEALSTISYPYALICGSLYLAGHVLAKNR